MGVLKGNQREVKEAVDLWMEEHWAAEGGHPVADHVTVDKGHGRIERRELWWVEAGELGAYLEEECDWPGVTVCGRIRRWRWKGDGTLEGVEEHTWVSSALLAQATPKQVQE